ncbi:MAG: dprA [Noviherbaspirillum sp.]|nr:dprA [Noviherbaspirillum sp.]
MRDDADARELAQWVRLQQTPRVGAATARKLLATFGLPENVFSASLAALRQCVSEHIAQALAASMPDDIRAQIDKTLLWAEQPGNRVITLCDEAYPPSLLDIPDPPLMLYAKGRTELLRRPALAVVGSRNATAQGVVNAEKFSEALSKAGLTIVSGQALGIDAAAHHGGLRGPGSTVAVIGTGADIVYPARNRTLAHQIAVEGCIISEYALGTPPAASNFPRRNRIISGLSRGVLVIEAAAQSGSLITARMAGDQGRDVFAIPGSIHSPLSKGCHQLIRQGAKLVESAEDILEEFKHHTVTGPMPVQVPDTAGPVSDPLLAAMGFDPVDIDTLAARCQSDISVIAGALLTLELEGLVEMLAGGKYRRLA